MSRRGTSLILALAICATLASAWIPAATFAPGPFIASSVGQNTFAPVPFVASSVGQNTSDERYQYLFLTRWHHLYSTRHQPQRVFESLGITEPSNDPPPTDDPKASRDRIRAQPMVAGGRTMPWPSHMHLAVFSVQEWGFPFRAFWSWRNVENPVGAIRTGFRESTGGEVSRQSSSLDSVSIPYLPLWLGLSANTLVYFLAFLAIAYTHRAVRSALRHRKGLCPNCRYDLKHTPPNSPCPECGKPVSSPRPSATNAKLSTPDASPPR